MNNTSAKLLGNETGNLKLDKITQEKINGSDQLLTVIPVLTNNKEEYSRILMSRINGVLRVVVFSMYPDKDIVTEHFSGKIMIRNLNGDFLNGFHVENGIYVTQYQIQKTTNNNTKREGVVETPSNAEKLTGVTIIHNYRRPNAATPWLYLYNDLDDSGGGFGNYSWDSGSGGGGGDGITAPTPEQIIDALTEKAKCLNALLNENGNSFVQKLLANFAGKSEFNITIISKDKVTATDSQGNIKEINGRTLSPKGTEIVIEISTSKTNEHSALDAARTILHEYIHADIFRKLNTTSTVVGDRAIDFKDTYDKYGNQHGAMAALYLNSMKEALKEFHKTALIDDYNKYTKYYDEVPSDDFYEALAWGGLRENNVKAWVDLSADKKTAIENLSNRATLLSKDVPCP